MTPVAFVSLEHAKQARLRKHWHRALRLAIREEMRALGYTAQAIGAQLELAKSDVVCLEREQLVIVSRLREAAAQTFVCDVRDAFQAIADFVIPDHSNAFEIWRCPK